MSEPIKVGDLVQVIGECCSHHSLLGLVFQVRAIGTFQLDCTFCNHHRDQATLAQVDSPVADEGCGWQPLSWLKRIPPLEELEGEKRREEIEA